MDDINESSAIVARREIRELIFNLETVLEEVGEEGGITVAELRERLLNTIADIKEQSRVSLVDSVRTRAHQIRNVMVSVDGFVTHYPWTAVLLGTGMGWMARALFAPRATPRDS
jgi:ElaB/YqjD/DUF883 family membrane-anchored ribosome-binding protein